MNETGDHLRRAADLVHEVKLELELARDTASDGEVVEMVLKAEEVAGNMETTLQQVAEKADRDDQDTRSEGTPDDE